MQQKINEKQIAITMRKEGNTYSDIQKVIGVSKGSLALWLKNIKIEQQDNYKNKIKKINHEKGIKSVITRKGTYTKRKIENIGGIKYLYCYNCKKMKPESEFHNRKEKTYKSSWCKQCLKEYVKQTWIDAINKLGGVCECGCNDIRLLEIHHINHDGKKDVDECGGHYQIYRKVINMPMNEVIKKYKVLCKICHLAHGLGIEEKYNITWNKHNNVVTEVYSVAYETVNLAEWVRSPPVAL